MPERWDDPAVQAYLAAFDGWLKAGMPEEGPTQDLRSAMLFEMVAGSRARARILAQIAAWDGISIRRAG